MSNKNNKNNNMISNENIIDKNIQNHNIDNQLFKFNFNFNIDLSSFADDCMIEQQALPLKIPLNNYIKYRQRESLQLAINDFYDWTLYYKLVLSTAKCTTISFSNKKKFRAYVYKLGKKKLELLHDISHQPQKYVNIMKDYNILMVHFVC